jgi:hypothetical protein
MKKLLPRSKPFALKNPPEIRTVGAPGAGLPDVRSPCYYQKGTAFLRERTTIGANMNAAMTYPQDDEIPAEVNFAGAARGKFYQPNLRINLPVYLDADVQAYLNVIAAKKGVALRNVTLKLFHNDPIKLFEHCPNY